MFPSQKRGVWWTLHVHGDLTFYSHAGVSIQGKFVHFFYKHAKGQGQREGWDLLRKEGSWEKESEADQSEEGKKEMHKLD